MVIGRHTRQRTIGLLGTGLVTFMQNQLWQGAMKAAQKHGTRLVYYPTISLSSSPPFTPQTKVLFDLIDARHIDGLLVWYAGIAEGIAIDGGKSFLDRYKGIPLVTIGGRLENRPDLSIDNYQGVYSAVEHLIKVHSRHHIAIVRGPIGHPDANERYRGYTEALQAYNLPTNPDYEAQSSFELKTAAEMTEAAIARWLQDLHLEIDAVVASSDYMALAAIRAIEARGLRVPEDIAVVGFDDVDDSQASIPSVTTVHQSFYDQGHQGTEMLLALIDGQTLPAQSIMPAQLVVRESCGCIAESLSLSNIAMDEQAKPEIGALNSSAENFSGNLITIAQDLNVPVAHLENLAMLLKSDLTSKTSHQFLPALRLALIEAQNIHFNAITWQNMLSLLRRQVLSDSNSDIGWFGETLFNQARVLVMEIHQRAYIRQQLIVEQKIENLLRTSEALITSFGEQLFIDTLYEWLPEIGFPGFFLSLYDNPNQPALWSHLILAYDNGHRLDLPADGLRFPTGQLIPESVLPSRPAAPSVVEPLYFRDEQLGILVLEAGPTEGAIYENLRAQISSALQGSRLLQQLLKRTQQLEAANSELEAFSYSVSHDLRAPLRAIDGFSHILIDDYGAALPENAQNFLRRIQSNVKRMSDLINDLLAFSRIGRKALQVEDVDMNQLVQEVLDDFRADNEPKQVEIVVDALPACKADRSLLKQVWINLISNAIKYSSKRENPHINIRHITRYHSVVYLVKDNGVGFDMRYVDKLFGVFQRLHGEDEYEGTGIGLAMVHHIIERHGGRVWADAELGNGATFYFTLGEQLLNNAQ
jgi:signal transduction histidine kinase/DNA-binding LacI/PurR family transcriptional regulator